MRSHPQWAHDQTRTSVHCAPAPTAVWPQLYARVAESRPQPRVPDVLRPSPRQTPRSQTWQRRPSHHTAQGLAADQDSPPAPDPGTTPDCARHAATRDERRDADTLRRDACAPAVLPRTYHTVNTAENIPASAARYTEASVSLPHR